MKNIASVIAVLGMVALLMPVADAAPLMKLSETEFDFGYTPQNSKVSHVFWIYNAGDDSLVIEKVVPG